MYSATPLEEGPRGQDATWRTPTARVRKTGDLQSARARQAEGEEGGWLKTRNREKSPLLHQKVCSVNASPEQELIEDWMQCKRFQGCQEVTPDMLHKNQVNGLSVHKG